MKYSKALVLLFDGARYDVFRDMLNAGRLPNIEKRVISRGSFLKGYSSLSTTTGPAHIPFLYGIYPGTANVPSIRWFDKTGKRGALVGFGQRSYVGPGSFSMPSDIKSGYIPIYDYFERPASIFSSLDDGNGVNIRNNRLLKVGSYIFAHYTNRWGRTDDLASELLKRYLSKGCDFIFAVFPAIDEITHLHHPRSERVLKQYAKLDGLVGEIFDCSSEEEMDKTLVFIVSDHGLSRTHTHIPLVDLSRSMGYRPVFYPRILRRRWDVAIMESGNAMASVYFREPVEERPAFYDEFMAVEKNRMFLDQILSCEGIDFVAYRVEDSTLGVKGHSGEIRLAFKDNGGTKLDVEGLNPLGFGVDGGEMDLDVLAKLSMETIYPDSPAQLRQLFSSDRTGDLVVFARKGFDLRKRYEWPEHKSSHGSLLKPHMEVPICTNASLSSEWCRTVDVFATILHLMGHKLPPWDRRADFGLIRESPT
jgi:hypothetical protein